MTRIEVHIADALAERLLRAAEASDRAQGSLVADAVAAHLGALDAGDSDVDDVSVEDRIIQRLLDDGATECGITIRLRDRLYVAWAEVEGEIVRASSSELRYAVEMLRARAERRTRRSR
jgi:hypothetical protein